MNFELSAEQELLRDTVRRFLAERAPIADHVRARLGDEVGVDGSVWSGLAELGVLGLLTGTSTDPPDLLSAGVVIEETGRALLREPYLASPVSAATALCCVEDPAATADLRRAIADGSRIVTVAIHEPLRRYDWRGPTCRARKMDDDWWLSGVKQPVLALRAADTILVTATANDGLALLSVDASDLDEAARTSVESVDVTRPTGRLELDEVRAARLAQIDPVSSTRRVLDVTGLGLALDGLGAASAVLDMTVEYARHRHQFGVPIGSFQAVQHLCADMLRDIEMARVGAYYALWAGQSADDDEFHRAATMAQAHAGDVLPRVGETAIQVFGGIGFTWEHDVHLFYRRLLGDAALYGDADAHFAEVARIALD